MDIRKLSEEERKKFIEGFKEYVSNRNGNSSNNNQTVKDIIDYSADDAVNNTFTRRNYNTDNMWNQVQNVANNYNQNKMSLWDNIKSTASSLGKITENTWLGFQNGFKSLQQTLGRRVTETLANRVDFTSQMQNELLENENNKISNNNDKISNSLLTGDKIREEERSTTQKIQNKKEENSNKINENIKNIDNPVFKKLAEISPSIGQMAPTFIPMAGAIYASGSATGQYYDDAKQRGMSDEEANTYSGIMGLMEGATEMIGIKNLSKAGQGIKTLIKGTGKEAVKEGTEVMTKNGLKSVLKEYGIGIADNVMQEALIDPIQEFTAQTVAGKDKANWDNMGKRMLEDGLNGGLVSAILGGANLGIQSCSGLIQKVNNNQKITQQEFQTAVKDAGQKLDTSKMVVSGVEQQLIKYKDYYTNQNLDANTQNILNQAKNMINKNNMTNLQQKLANDKTNFQNQQITQEQNKMAQNGDMGQINNSIANSQQMMYNDIGLDRVRNVPIKDVLHLKTDGGYRNEQYMAKLRENIKRNGIKNPIELVKNKDGSIEIENGNHRLQVANELGLKEVPIKFVESWDKIGIDQVDANSVKKWEDYYDGNNENRARINDFNERIEFFKRSMDDNRNQLKNGTTTTSDDRLLNRVQGDNDRTSSSSAFEENSQKIGENILFNNKDKLIQKINKSYLSDETKKAFIEDLRQVKDVDMDRETYNNLSRVIEEEQKLPDNLSYKTDENRKRLYVKYKNSVIDYDSSSLDIALSSVKANRNGKRTVSQWLEVAERLGQQIADKSNDEIERIAFQSWNDLQPNTKDSITRYDNITKKKEPFTRFSSDDWVNTVYRTVNDIRKANVANNHETLYNNTESVGGINEQLQRRGFLEGNTEQTRIHKDSQPQQKEYTRAEYEKWERSVEPIKEADITTEQRTIRNNIKRQYNKDIVFFDGNNSDNGYSGGVSYDNPNKINIDTKQAETFGLNKMIYHEVLESDILNNTELYKDMIKPSIEKIMNDPSFEKQKSFFWEGQEDNVPSDYLIAKDILCDRFSEIKTGEKLDYKNVLSQETNMTMDYAIENFHKSLYGRNVNENMKKSVTRHETIQKYRELAKENIENIATWKDKSNGLKYQLETMERNMFDIIPDKVEAQKMVDTYFEPIHKAEADKQRFINRYNERIKDYDLNKYEAEAVQVLGEYKYNPSFKTDGVDEHNQTILDRVNKNIEKGRVDKEKVNEAIETFRSIYDELFEIENKTLREYGYEEKSYRKGYFPHFIEDVPTTKVDKLLDKLGFKVDRRSLPTDIAGITEQFVPGKTWNRSALERKGNKTDYNALKGFDTYIQQASDNIFHTENIQKLRGLENEIRYQYSDKGVQERIDEILNNETLFEEEKQDLMDKIFAQVDNSVPNLVTELRRYTNALANKKSEADRSTEQCAGRQFYNTVNAIENRFGANAVGLNIGSAVTNFIPITQAYSQVSTKNMGRAFIDTVKSYVKNDGFVDKSTFLTNRLNQSEKLYKTSLEKISDKTSFLFNAIDEVTSNIVVRGKYWENISKGMTETEAMKNADRFAANVIADRSKGSLPTKFEEKNPLTKMFTQFQLEVNNQYRYMFKDIPRDLKDKGVAQVALAFFKMFVGAWLYNEVSEEVTGRKSAFSPIDLAISSYGTMTDSSKTTYQKISGVATEIGEQAPFVGGLLGGGRVPVDGAIPDVKNLVKAGTGLATNEMDSKKAKEMIGKEFSKPLYYVLPPFGGGQMKKSVEGIQTVKNGGSYGVDDKGEKILKFPVESKSAKNYIKAGVFGKYALEEAKGYSDRDYKSLNANETKMYEEANLPYKELLEYLDRGLKKKEDKIQYINSKDMNSQQKWGIYKNDIFSKTKREDGTSELSDIEFIVSNGVKKSDFIVLYNKAQENNIDIPKIDDYKSMKEKGISLKNYIDYNVKVKNETKKKIDSGEIKDKQQLKGKDKIQILLNSNYTNNEKSAIYENYIRTKPKENEADLFKVLKQSNINIDEYLRYEQQDFKSDKEDDGTTKGKSVSGSKKIKVYNYVNNMKITRDQKLILLGSQYKLNNSERTELANLINKLPNQTKDEKMKLYEKMKGFTVYKNGNVSW